MKRFYPAILERGPKKTFAVWFPDFPDCVVAGTSQEHALERAEDALNRAADTAAEQSGTLPNPTPFDQITLPKGCQPVAFLALGVEPPDPSERVNIYLPKSLIARADKRAAEFGMSRSSFFGLAITTLIGTPEPHAVLAALSKRQSLQNWEALTKTAKARRNKAKTQL